MLATGKSFKKRITGQPNQEPAPGQLQCGGCSKSVEAGKN